MPDDNKTKNSSRNSRPASSTASLRRAWRRRRGWHGRWAWGLKKWGDEKEFMQHK